MHFQCLVLSTSVTITWSPWKPGEDIGDGPVVEYRLYYKEEGESNGYSAAYVNADAVLTYLFIDLEPETNYYFSVTAVRERDGEGPRSPSENATTPCNDKLYGLGLVSQNLSDDALQLIPKNIMLDTVNCEDI